MICKFSQSAPIINVLTATSNKQDGEISNKYINPNSHWPLKVIKSISTLRFSTPVMIWGDTVRGGLIDRWKVTQSTSTCLCIGAGVAQADKCQSLAAIHNCQWAIWRFTQLFPYSKLLNKEVTPIIWTSEETHMTYTCKTCHLRLSLNLRPGFVFW